MGTKQRPGRYDGYNKALNDEPLFVLLARDPSAPELIELWAKTRKKAMENGTRPKSDQTQVDEANATAKEMRTWRLANDGRWRD